MKHLYIILISVLLLSACKKETIEPMMNPADYPVFLEGTNAAIANTTNDTIQLKRISVLKSNGTPGGYWYEHFFNDTLKFVLPHDTFRYNISGMPCMFVGCAPLAVDSALNQIYYHVWDRSPSNNNQVISCHWRN